MRRIGGRGKPDGLATARLGPRAIDGGPTGYSVTYDAKSSSKDAIAAATANTSGLKKHRKDYSATFSLLVAPDFQGAKDDTSNLADACAATKEDPGITPIRVEDLARLVELSPFRAVSPETLRPLFECHLPEDSKAFVDELAGQPEPEATPVEAILDAIDRYSERKDAVSIETLNTALFDQLGRDLGVRHLMGIVIGLKALAPIGLYWDGVAVALNKTKDMVMAEMKATISALPAEISTSYREILGVE